MGKKGKEKKKINSNKGTTKGKCRLEGNSKTRKL